jgi:hypothetical protein
MKRSGIAWLALSALALGGAAFAACGDGSVNLSCDPTTDPACADGGLPDGASWPDGTVIEPDGAVVLPDGAIVTPDSVSPDAPTPDALTCKGYGDLCAGGGECCSGVCDSSNHCTSTIGACKANLQPCSTATECCSLSCVSGACAAAACTSDGKTCTSNAQCCSGTCNGGSCQALNTACKTAGNDCTANSQCCSSLCKAGKCELASSYCTQVGDVCARGVDCCSGICNIAAGKSLGTCAAQTGGAVNCTGVDGTVCNGCGDCCSRLCQPYGPTGVHICQPANGCHVTGDLCKKNADCCGAAGSGVPGDGNVTCEIPAGQTIGVCRNPLSCNPEGNICHYKADSIYQCTSSSTRNDCCDALGAKSDCKLDGLGVPRCNGGGACKAAGQACAYSGDCCGGLPCVPNPSGSTPPYVCGSVTCEPSGATCTIDGDCCKGLTCNKPPGSASGTCGTYVPPPPDGGVLPDGAVAETSVPDGGILPDGAVNPDATPPVCSLYGQSCSSASDCCNGVPCKTATGVDCNGASAGCTCHDFVQ